MWKFQGSTEKERSGISMIDKENIMLNFHKSSFLTLEFARGATQFHGICKGKVLFCPEVPRVK